MGSGGGGATRDWSNAGPAFLLAGNSILQLDWLFACFSHGRLLNRFRVTVTSYRFLPHVASFISSSFSSLPRPFSPPAIFLVGPPVCHDSLSLVLSPQCQYSLRRISVLSESYDCRGRGEPQARTLPRARRERKLRQRTKVAGEAETPFPCHAVLVAVISLHPLRRKNGRYKLRPAVIT